MRAHRRAPRVTNLSEVANNFRVKASRNATRVRTFYTQHHEMVMLIGRAAATRPIGPDLARTECVERLTLTLPTGAGDTAHHFGSRRESRRFPVFADVQVELPHCMHGVAINVSAGGIRIAIDSVTGSTPEEALRVGEAVRLRVCFPSGEETLEHGRVVWSKTFPDGSVVGVQFIQPS